MQLNNMKHFGSSFWIIEFVITYQKWWRTKMNVLDAHWLHLTSPFLKPPGRRPPRRSPTLGSTGEVHVLPTHNRWPVTDSEAKKNICHSRHTFHRISLLRQLRKYDRSEAIRKHKSSVNQSSRDSITMHHMLISSCGAASFLNSRWVYYAYYSTVKLPEWQKVCISHLVWTPGIFPFAEVLWQK